AGAVQAIDVTADGQTIAVATDDGAIHVSTQRKAAVTPGAAVWATLEARARHVALAPDGLLIAACADGTIWLYSPVARRWLCLEIGTADGKAAVTLDRGGRLLWIDLESVRHLLHTTDST